METHGEGYLGWVGTGEGQSKDGRVQGLDNSYLGVYSDPLGGDELK